MDKKEMEKSIEASRKYQREHFAVNVVESKHEPHGVEVEFTHNGNQWTVVSLHTREEIYKTIDALEKYLTQTQEDK